jgi:hypothetical protein
MSNTPSHLGLGGTLSNRQNMDDVYHFDMFITLGPQIIQALELFQGYVSPCLMDLFTPKNWCKCLNIYRSYGSTV